jgi:lysophospholipase L1-like esterase
MEETISDDADGHPAGVWRAAAILAVAASFVWIPYVVPGIEEMQVVGPEDDWPLTDLLKTQPRQGGAGLAGAFRSRNVVVEEDDEALLAAAPLPPALDVATPRDQVARMTPTPTPADRGGPAQDGRGPIEPLGQPTPPGIPVERIDPRRYEGLTQQIEDPSGAMRDFYRQLARVSAGREVLARVGVYGTSTNGADRMTSQLRRLMQAQFGDGGKGWVPVAAGWRFQRHQDVEWDHDHWRTYVVNRGDGPLDRYGYGGVVAISRHRGAYASMQTVESGPGQRVSRFRLFYQAFPEGGPLSVQVDEGAPRVVSTGAATVEDRVLDLDVPDAPHTLTLRSAAEEGGGAEDLRLYGVAMERDGPGVVVDGLALIGAFTRVLRLFDREHLATQVRQRDPDLLVFWMGANDAVSESVAFVPDRYRRHYRTILRRYQEANPDMSCMVMSILDKGERVNGRIRTRDRVPRLVEVQREVALAEGCAFFNTYEAMGGEGTMRRWYRNRPRLVTDDLGHLTASGSRIMGTLLFRAILKGYDDWLAAGQPAPR